MKTALICLVFIFLLVTVQACSGGNTQKEKNNDISDGIMPSEFSTRFSSIKIKKERELFYAEKRRELKRKNPVDDVNKAIQDNNIYLMIVSEGRGRSRSFPGVLEPQVIIDNCNTVAVNGMGDVLYGKNHRLYRQELLQYMITFNSLMLSYCK